MKSLPIRVRLTAWYSLILALSIGVSGSIAYFAMSHSINAAIDVGLRHRLDGIRTIIARTSPQGRNAVVDELNEYDEGLGGRGLISVTDENGSVIYASAGMAALTVPDRHVREAKPFYAKLNGDEFRVLREPINVAEKIYDIEVATYTEDFDRATDRFQRVLYSIAPAFLLLAALGGYWISRRALAPVEKIIGDARRIGVTGLSERLTVSHTGDELERLADTLNEMLARLEASFQRVTQFTADASHELRTPISVMRTNAEITLRKSRTESEYREALSQILGETENLSRLVEQLLDLARADSGAAALTMSRTNLSEALRKASRQAQVLAEQKELKIRAQLPEQPVWVQGDLEGNCLIQDGRLSGIVDWGSACAGDPAVDVQVVWSPLFTNDSRHSFLDALGIDDATLARSRGAAINQACAALPYYFHSYPRIVERSWHKLAMLGVHPLDAT